LVMVFSACASGQEKVFPYTFNTAKIEYKISGDIDGNMTTYIKGDQSVNKLSGTASPDNEPVSTLTISLGESIYFVDLVSNTGYSTQNPIYAELKTLNKKEKQERLLSYATNTNYTEGKPEVVEQREYAGKKCDLYAIEGIGEICLWEGVPLYSKASFEDRERIIQTTSISTEIDIPDSEFQLPEGVSIQDARALE
jgi:hypothetical protein